MQVQEGVRIRVRVVHMPVQEVHMPALEGHLRRQEVRKLEPLLTAVSTDCLALECSCNR